MNYSDAELSGNRTDEALVAAGMQLLPVIARALFSAISNLGNTFGLTPAQVKVLLQRRQLLSAASALTADAAFILRLAQI